MLEGWAPAAHPCLTADTIRGGQRWCAVVRVQRPVPWHGTPRRSSVLQPLGSGVLAVPHVNPISDPCHG